MLAVKPTIRSFQDRVCLEARVNRYSSPTTHFVKHANHDLGLVLRKAHDELVASSQLLGNVCIVLIENVIALPSLDVCELLDFCEHLRVQT